MELRPDNIARVVKDLLCEPEDLRLSRSFHCRTACILKSQERFCSQRPLVAFGKSPMRSPPHTSAHRLVLFRPPRCPGITSETSLSFLGHSLTGEFLALQLLPSFCFSSKMFSEPEYRSRLVNLSTGAGHPMGLGTP